MQPHSKIGPPSDTCTDKFQKPNITAKCQRQASTTMPSPPTAVGSHTRKKQNERS